MYLQKVSRKNCVKNLVFCWHLEGNAENSRIRIQDPDSDPLVRGMDPWIRIHPKMAWIRNTAFAERIVCGNEYCGYVTFWYGSGSADPYLYKRTESNPTFSFFRTRSHSGGVGDCAKKRNVIRHVS
jgi:hypothetical protein